MPTDFALEILNLVDMKKLKNAEENCQQQVFYEYFHYV